MGVAMGCRILTGEYDGYRTQACMVDSVTETAFGPLFDSYEDCEDFIQYVQRRTGHDPRRLDWGQLDDAHTRWLETKKEAEPCRT